MAAMDPKMKKKSKKKKKPEDAKMGKPAPFMAKTGPGMMPIKKKAKKKK